MEAKEPRFIGKQKKYVLEIEFVSLNIKHRRRNVQDIGGPTKLQPEAGKNFPCQDQKRFGFGLLIASCTSWLYKMSKFLPFWLGSLFYCPIFGAIGESGETLDIFHRPTLRSAFFQTRVASSTYLGWKWSLRICLRFLMTKKWYDAPWYYYRWKFQSKILGRLGTLAGDLGQVQWRLGTHAAGLGYA